MSFLNSFFSLLLKLVWWSLDGGNVVCPFISDMFKDPSAAVEAYELLFLICFVFTPLYFMILCDNHIVLWYGSFSVSRVLIISAFYLCCLISGGRKDDFSIKKLHVTVFVYMSVVGWQLWWRRRLEKDCGKKREKLSQEMKKSLWTYSKKCQSFYEVWKINLRNLKFLSLRVDIKSECQ